MPALPLVLVLVYLVENPLFQLYVSALTVSSAIMAMAISFSRVVAGVVPVASDVTLASAESFSAD
jgi:hypothetical protein